MAKKKVHVFDRDGDYVVEPGVVELSSTDSLRLINNTDEDLLWLVNDNTLFQGGAVNETVLSRKFSPPKNPVNTANFFGVASYFVIGVKSGKKAKGNSDPVIIIDN